MQSPNDTPASLWKRLFGEPIRAFGIVSALLLVLLAILYFSVPANEFAPWFPGYDPELTRVRMKHGILSLVVGAGLFGYAWYRSRGRSA